MSLNTIIPPEIVDCELARWLATAAAHSDVKYIIEVGSSSGLGSTQSLLRGIERNPNPDIRLDCIELSQQRFAELEKNLQGFGQSIYPREVDLRAHRGCSVKQELFMGEEEVREFHKLVKTGFSNYPIDMVLGWLKDDLDAAESAPANLLEKISCNVHPANTLAFLDGSAFCGFAEAVVIDGAKFIILDDVIDIKHWSSYHMLKEHGYKVIAENPKLRNGFAVLERQ